VNIDWEQLYEEHAAALLLYARQWLPTRSEAEDAVHDGFVRLLKSPRRFGERPVPLLYQAVKWAALDRLRRTVRRERREQSAFPGDDGTDACFEHPAERNERRALVQQAMQQLPEEQREVLTMHLWGQLGFREIGVALGISPNTAASRYRYALKKLGDSLAPHELTA
jgi:RNA polymerase sigma-70 factor (ECF subfamily)